MPPGVVNVMLLGPMAAVVVVLKVALICVGLTGVTPVTVRPFAGATTLTVDPAVKLLPVRTTATGLAAAAVLRRPEAGVIEARIGVPGFTTVNVTGVVVPAAETVKGKLFESEPPARRPGEGIFRYVAMVDV